MDPLGFSQYYDEEMPTPELRNTGVLYEQYDEQLTEARKSAQSIILASEKEAKQIVASEIEQARKDAAKLIDKTNRELETQKTLALEKLETQVDELSDLIKEKLLGKEVVL